MALATDYERFPPFRFHYGFPLRISEFIQIADHVNLIQLRSLRAAQLTDMGIKPLPNGSFPVVILPLEYRVGQETLFAVCDFNRFHSFGSAFGFIWDRPRFPIFVLTNDFADAGFVLIGNGFQTAVLHEIAEIVQRVVIAGQIIEVAQPPCFGVIMFHNFNVR